MCTYACVCWDLRALMIASPRLLGNGADYLDLDNSETGGGHNTYLRT